MTEPGEVPPLVLHKEPWRRALCPLCGRFPVQSLLFTNSKVARQAKFECGRGHKWMTTWERL